MKRLILLVLVILVLIWSGITANQVFSWTYELIWPYFEPFYDFIRTIREHYPLIYFIFIPFLIILLIRVPTTRKGIRAWLVQREKHP